MTMTASQIRNELLGQHAEVRSRIAETRLAIERLRQGDPARDLLRSALARLADAVRRHNEREEELLKDLIPTVDAWGPARAEVMVDQHAKEHQAMYSVLVEAGATPETDTAIALATRLVDQMVEHMVVEEKVLLGEDVLSDELVPREYFGG